MKYRIVYGNQVVSFPKSVLDVIKRATAAELKVLLCLCGGDTGADVKKLTRMTGCGADEVRDALAFWRGAGIIEPCPDGDADKDIKTDESNESKQNADEKKPAKKLARSNELPDYTSNQLSDIIDNRSEIATLIDECQRIMGKMFTVKEINVLIGLVDYLGLECEYIMMLLSHCMSIGKKTLHYAEKTAFGLYEAGICTVAELTSEFEKRDRARDIEGKVRSLFGIGERAFTTKEKKNISAWVNDMGYSAEIITKAYEVTVDATGKGSIPYANSVLERWNAAGLRTLQDIEESYKKKESPLDSESSFDTDAFFDAAVKRALGNN